MSGGRRFRVSGRVDGGLGSTLATFPRGVVFTFSVSALLEDCLQRVVRLAAY